MNTTTTNPHLQQLTEHISDWHSDHVSVDVDQRIVCNVALTGRDSKNGYHYSETALRGAIKLYEGKPVFLDHATNRTRPHDRSTRDLVGSIINPRFENDRIRGDIQTLDTEAGRTFVALAKTISPAVGMSHVVLAERGKDRLVVEKIHEVVSVDAVVFPATTATFSESDFSFAMPSHNTPADTLNPNLLPGTIEAILQEIDFQLPGCLHRLTGDTFVVARRVGLFSDRVIIELQQTEKTDSEYHEICWNMEQGRVTLAEKMQQVEIESLQTDELLTGFFKENKRLSCIRKKLEQVTEERNGLLKRIEENVRKQHRQKRTEEVKQLLNKSTLPKSAIDDNFRQQLIETIDTKKRFKLIEERKRLVQTLASSSPYSFERDDVNQQTLADESFISILQGTSTSVRN